jgi:hypothetical protein
MKILILSDPEWDDSNCFGSSFSNILGNIEEIEIANIYCRSGIPKTDSCNQIFQITEKLLLKNLLDFRKPAGQVVSKSSSNGNTPDIFGKKQQRWIDFVKKNRWGALFWLRDIVWLIGRWKSKELKQFVDDFKPDLIFLPIFYSVYLSKIGIFLKCYTHKPLVGYISDDNYTLRQFSISPFFWIDRLIKRRWVKKAVGECKILYVISEVQKRDYDPCFRKDCKILYKGGVFTGSAPIKNKINNPVQLVYTGNVGTGRYKSLSGIGKALDNINRKGMKAVLHIYSQTPLSNLMKSSLLTKKSIKFYGGVPQSQMKEIQTNADILVHAESFQLKERLLVRQSFSTKIVDYFLAARCIFAVGWDKAASIDYLIKNNAAMVACHKNEIEKKLRTLIEHPELIIEYGEKGWDCGKRNHTIREIQSRLVADFESLL